MMDPTLISKRRRTGEELEEEALLLLRESVDDLLTGVMGWMDQWIDRTRPPPCRRQADPPLKDAHRQSKPVDTHTHTPHLPEVLDQGRLHVQPVLVL